MKTPDWVFKIAAAEKEYSSFSDYQERVNELCSMNGLDNAFSYTEIALCKIIEGCRDMKEKARLICWQKFDSAYYAIKVNYQMLEKELLPSEINDIKLCYKNLKEIDSLDLLLKGLNEKTLKYLETII